MSDPLPANFTSEIRRVQQTSPFLFLWRIFIKTRATPANTDVVDLVNNDEPITWSGITFKPWQIEQGDIEYSGEGNLPTMTLSIDNTTRVLSPYVMAAGGFVGENAFVWLVNKNNLTGAPLTSKAFSWRIAAAILGKSLTLRLELPNLHEIEVPQMRFNAQKCRFLFGLKPCPYALNGGASFTVCGHTIPDCTLRDADMRNRGLAGTLEKFGGFVGIPIQR